MTLKEWNNLPIKKKTKIEETVFSQVKNSIKELLDNELELNAELQTDLGAVNVEDILPSRTEILIAVEDAIMFRKIDSSNIVNVKAATPEEKVSKMVYNSIILDLLEHNKDNILQKILIQNIKKG